MKTAGVQTAGSLYDTMKAVCERSAARSARTPARRREIMNPFTHKVQYYETDMMGVAHHANYIHWMEEARIDFMDQLGFPYTEMERKGILSPVKALSCEYKHPCTFGDEISISVSVDSFNGVIMTIVYAMVNGGGETVCEARSEHVFLDKKGHFVRLKREMPDFCVAIEASQSAGRA